MTAMPEKIAHKHFAYLKTTVCAQKVADFHSAQDRWGGRS